MKLRGSSVGGSNGAFGPLESGGEVDRPQEP